MTIEIAYNIPTTSLIVVQLINANTGWDKITPQLLHKAKWIKKKQHL